jgi:hypothetical protein
LRIKEQETRLTLHEHDDDDDDDDDDAGLIKVKPCSAFLRMLLELCIHSYLKSVLSYNFLILDTCHLDTLYLGEPVCEDPWLFSEVKRSPRAQQFGKQCFKTFMIIFILHGPNTISSLSQHR